MTGLATNDTPRRRFPVTVEMYHALGESGTIEPDKRIELIDGEMYEMSPIGNLHARCVKLLANFLIGLFSGRQIIGVQDPIILDDRSEPQPDIAVLAYREDFYKDALPSAADVRIVMEVSDSTVAFDRKRKLPKYASAGIQEVWLIDLGSEQVEVHLEPEGQAYGKVKTYRRGERAVSENLPELSIGVDELFG